MAAEKITNSIIAIGHVDHGKSTLLGNILKEFGCISDQKIRKNEKDAILSGAGSDRASSFELDILPEERIRGKTFEYDVRECEYNGH